MSIQQIDLGTSPNDGTGDDARTAGGKINSNFTFLQSLIDAAASEVENDPYPDIAAMLADQVNQTVGKIQYVVDASADPNITSGSAHYEKLSTSTATLAQDYRLLTPEESIVLITSSGLITARVNNVDTTMGVSVDPGLFDVKYENVGNKVTNILVNAMHTDYYEPIAGLTASKTLHLNLINWSRTKVLIAKINSFTYSDGSNTYYDIALEQIIDKANLVTNDFAGFYISASPLQGTGDLLAANNLSDVNDAETSRINLKVGYETVNQTAHGFAVGDAIKHNGTNFIKAQADSVLNAGVIGVVSAVADVDNFTYQFSGILTSGSWTNGTEYFLSTSTAGSIVTEPVEVEGEVKQFIGTGVPGGLLLEIAEGFEIVAANDRLEEDTTVTGTKNIDWEAYETFKYVLTGNCTFSDTNLPTSGSKTITLHISGNFTPTWPSGWTTYITGSYDGAASLNTVVAEYVKAATAIWKVAIIQED